MKTEIFESDYGLNIKLTPEMVEETTMLLRYVRNASSEKPEVSFQFPTSIPHCDIWLPKRNMKSNFIKPNMK
jgi:hypothetical protein